MIDRTAFRPPVPEETALNSPLFAYIQDKSEDDLLSLLAKRLELPDGAKFEDIGFRGSNLRAKRFKHRLFTPRHMIGLCLFILDEHDRASDGLVSFSQIARHIGNGVVDDEVRSRVLAYLPERLLTYMPINRVKQAAGRQRLK